MSQGCGFSPVRVAGTSPWRPRCHFLPGSPGPGPAQAGRDRSDVTARRLSPVRRHIATVTAAAARPGTGQRTGPRRRLRPVRHPGNRVGYLAVCDPPQQTIDELAEALLASRSAITGAVKLLEGYRAVRRERVAG